MKRFVAVVLVLVLIFSFTAFAKPYTKHKISARLMRVKYGYTKVRVRNSYGMIYKKRVKGGFTFVANRKCTLALGGTFYGYHNPLTGKEYYVYGKYLTRVY